ncbi:uncharacterized protein LOC126551847 [Aphis gossypii]|uniref:uncharacterized protein LOC126551847 n=1 Tax=Aphis gossypii TaxID=80765 RepID=UPI0021590C74|nr:uncharacterized protein LOC126551847 [Aphis gossypii]
MEENNSKSIENEVSKINTEEVNSEKVNIEEVNISEYNGIEEMQKNQDCLLEKKQFLPYGVGPVVDCEIDDDSDEPDYIRYVSRPKTFKIRTRKLKTRPKKTRFLPYGVGPVVDCEIDDDSDEPDYLSYARIPRFNRMKITSTSTSKEDAVP